MRSFTIPSGKAELTGIEDGKGLALVFLHAGVADKRMWRDQMAAFATEVAPILTKPSCASVPGRRFCLTWMSHSFRRAWLQHPASRIRPSL